MNKLSIEILQVMYAMIRIFEHFSEDEGLILRSKVIKEEIDIERKLRGIKDDGPDLFNGWGYELGRSLYEGGRIVEGNQFINEGMDDEELLIWYGLGIEVSDFSCLGKVVRGYVMHIGVDARDELEKRGVELVYLDDLMKR